MNANEEKICPACGKALHPSKRTAHNQKYCSEASCQKTRAHEKKMRWRKNHESEWKQLANKYSAESHKRKREREKTMAKDLAIAEINGKDQQPRKNALLVGMAAFISHAKTCDEIVNFLARMERKGKALIESCLWN